MLLGKMNNVFLKPALDEIAIHELRKRSNRLSVMFIKTKNPVGIHGSIKQHNNVWHY